MYVMYVMYVCMNVMYICMYVRLFVCVHVRAYATVILSTCMFAIFTCNHQMFASVAVYQDYSRCIASAIRTNIIIRDIRASRSTRSTFISVTREARY